MTNPKSQIPGSSYSTTSQFSEPPDIKKWFSSYTYESPAFDTYEKLLFSVGVDDEKKGLCSENEEEEENCEVLAKINHSNIHEFDEKVGELELPSPADVEVPAYSDSLSLPSEPPDITNWFSSYVYNSPELDSADFDVSLSSGCISRENQLKRPLVTKVNNEIQGCKDETTRPSRVDNNFNTSTAHEDDSQRGNLSPKDNSFAETTSDQKTSRAKQNICNTLPDQSVACPRIEDKGLLSIVQEENTGLIRSPEKALLPYNRYRGLTESSEETAEKNSTAAENDPSSCWISLNRKPREESCGGIKKEQEQHIPAENRFISTKKKSRPRISRENSPVKSVCTSDEQPCGTLRRDILKDRTNFDFSAVPEVAGKWRCPQKNKPDYGPPLKQLRLERWVHKI